MRVAFLVEPTTPGGQSPPHPLLPSLTFERRSNADIAPLAMRFIFGISCLLLGLGMLSCRVGPVASGSSGGEPQSVATTRGVEWVRTVDGWERVDSWYLSEVRPPRLHPLVVAAAQGLASLLGLAACQRDRQAAPPAI